jgi:hypothetical protein
MRVWLPPGCLPARPGAGKSDPSVTRSSGGHGHARIIIGLILTGFAYVAAGRRTNRRLASLPRMPVISDRRHPGPAVPTPPTRSSADPLVATRAAEIDRRDAPDVSTAAVASGPVVSPSYEPQVPLALPGETPESLDAVMSRVDALLETAASCVAARNRIRSSVTASPPTHADNDQLALPPEDIASGAALFLAGGGTGSTAGSDPLRPPSNEAPARHPEGTSEAPAQRGPEDPMVTALRRVGLDASVIGSVTEGLRRGTDLETLLLQAFAPLAAAPALPRRPGSLLVVVGDGTPARRLAAALAGEMGTDPAVVPFASLDTQAHMVATGPLLVRSAEDAAVRGPGWRRSQPAVVVVDASVTGTDRSWATHLISALRPTAVWGVVDATAKTEDIAAWTEDLGGVDALALEHLDATVSPAAVLSLGAPVARIDGQPATAARWVATVVDRIKPCR